MKKIVFIIVLFISILQIAISVRAEDIQMSVDDILEQMNLEQIDEYDGNLNYKELCKSIIFNGVNFKNKNLIGQIKNAVVEELNNNKNALIQILIIAFITSFFNTIAFKNQNDYIVETANNISYIIIITILMALFTFTLNITRQTILNIRDFIVLLIPALLSCMIFCGQDLSFGAFSEIFMILIIIINTIYLRFLITGNKIYMMLCVCDGITKENNLKKLCNLFHKGINYVMKISIGILAGMNFVQSLIVPLVDATKINAVTKTVKLIPGAGDVTAAVTSTMLGCMCLIKNGMGVAAMIVLLVIALIPCIRIFTIYLMLQALSAVIYSICGKRISDVIDMFAKGINLSLKILVYSLITVFMVISTICLVANK